MARNLSKALIGTTCLTLSAAGPAVAGTVIESVDFPGTRAAAVSLPVGTDTVQGGGCCSDFDDFFTFQNVPFGSHTFTFSFDNCCGFASADIYVGPATTPTYSHVSSLIFSLIETSNVTIGVNMEGEVGYTASLTGVAAPEPSTLLLGAAGLAGALAWRRKRSAK